MLKQLPGEDLLRALLAIVEAIGDPESELRAAVDAFYIRGRDAKAERQFLEKMPEQGELVLGLEALENICLDFSESLSIHVLEWPSPFPPPRDSLIAAAAAAVVFSEFRIACGRANVKERKGEEDGNFRH